jgi:hypothetical protein
LGGGLWYEGIYKYWGVLKVASGKNKGFLMGKMYWKRFGKKILKYIFQYLMKLEILFNKWKPYNIY